jgi:hypothetical protein
LSQHIEETTHTQEEMIYAYFVHVTRDHKAAELHYSSVVKLWPKSYLRWAFYGLFLSEVVSEFDSAESAYRQAVVCFEEQSKRRREAEVHC